MKTHKYIGPEDFQRNCGDYFINVTRESGRYTLHRKNCRRCQYSKAAYEYIDFNTTKEAEQSGLNFKYCMNCFPEKRSR